MNFLTVSADFEPGTVRAKEFCRDDGSRWVALSFNSPHSPSLSVHLTDLAQVDDLAVAIARAREYLSNDSAALDAA